MCCARSTCAGTWQKAGKTASWCGVFRGSLLAARYTARVAETATEWAVNMRWLRVAQEAATPPSKRSPVSSRAREAPGCMMCLSVLRAEAEYPAYSEKPVIKINA
jgi:hypothetical protein